MFKFVLTPDDGGEKIEVRAGTRDIYFWEKTNHGKAVANLLAAPAMVDLYALAHAACQRQGIPVGTLKEFVDGHELDFDEETAEEASAPVPQAPLPASASRSPSSQASPPKPGRAKAKGR